MIKTKARTFPPGTFIPTPLRVVAIIQLCIAFSAILYDMGHPFMGQLFEQKRLKGVYESIIQENDRFQQLPYQQQLNIQEGYKELADSMQLPFSTKMSQSTRILLIELPPFQKAWIFFSIIIPLLMLMKIDGAHRAAWVLPIITLVFIANQYTFPAVPENLKEYALFPTEKEIFEGYLKVPLADSISDQREQLINGWHLYLIDQWVGEEPSNDQSVLERQVADGLFAFNISRVEAIKEDSAFPSYLRKKGPFLLMTFLAWNLFFAWFANRRKWFL